MDPDLLTQLVRAGNDGVIPAPLAGEDMAGYKFRAACAGAAVATKWLETKMAEQAEHEAYRKAEKERVREEMSGAAMGGGRPDDVPMTSPDGTALHPHRTSAEIDRILRGKPAELPSLNGGGQRQGSQDLHPDMLDEIGVD